MEVNSVPNPVAPSRLTSSIYGFGAAIANGKRPWDLKCKGLHLKEAWPCPSAPSFLTIFCLDLFLGSDNLPTHSALPSDSTPGCLGGLVWFFFSPLLLFTTLQEVDKAEHLKA